MDVLNSCKGLRVLLVGPYPPPYGGIASHLTTLIPGLLARGAADVRVLCFGGRDEVVQINGATVYYCYPRLHIRKLFSLRGLRAIFTAFSTLVGARLGVKQTLEEALKTLLISQIADRHGSNVVSFYQSPHSYAMLPCISLWKRCRGVVLTIFGELYDDPSLLKNSKNFMDRLISLPNSVASSSCHCACSFSKLLGISREIQPVYYGIDLDRFSVPELRDSYRNELDLAPDDIVLVFMGRFTMEMGIGPIIEMGPMLLEQLPQIKFLLVGNKGPLADSATAFATRYPNRVRIMHDVPFELQPSIYAASDIVLAPSHDQHACMGMSIKEAMAASRPVIGTRAGGIPEAVIDGVTGLLVSLDSTKHADKAELYRTISLLALNAEMRAAMGNAARLRAEELFSMERTIDTMGKLFVEAIPA